jgi:hypothetical protein
VSPSEAGEAGIDEARGVPGARDRRRRGPAGGAAALRRRPASPDRLRGRSARTDPGARRDVRPPCATGDGRPVAPAKVVDYCLDGGLQAVLTEYAHILREALGHLDRVAGTIVPPMADAMFEALSVRAANYSADAIRVDDGGVVVTPRRLRARYALRFGAQTPEAESELQRAGVVRTAFNSPFWPFVLATTSVGQEGLDFPPVLPRRRPLESAGESRGPRAA